MFSFYTHLERISNSTLEITINLFFPPDGNNLLGMNEISPDLSLLSDKTI